MPSTSFSCKMYTTLGEMRKRHRTNFEFGRKEIEKQNN
jgi:hypothetical protein